MRRNCATSLNEVEPCLQITSILPRGNVTKGIVMSVVIYHHERCTTSLAVLEMIRAAGIEPIVIDYMKTPPSHEEMLALLVAMDMSPRALLRTREKAYL
jgi:hypothetical protein